MLSARPSELFASGKGDVRKSVKEGPEPGHGIGVGRLLKDTLDVGAELSNRHGDVLSMLRSGVPNSAKRLTQHSQGSHRADLIWSDDCAGTELLHRVENVLHAGERAAIARCEWSMFGDVNHCDQRIVGHHAEDRSTAGSLYPETVAQDSPYRIVRLMVSYR